VAQPSAISITAINTTTAGCGLPNGSATVSVSGGSGVYSTIWDNGETGMMADSLIVGLHTVWVYDSSGCVDSLQITIPNAQPLQVVADSVKAPTCHGGSDGFASAVVSGGVAPYTFMWNNAINQPANFNLQSGTATLVVTDAIGCTDSIALWIPVTDSIRIQLDSVHHVLCYGDPSAFLEISVDGGTKPYAINWSNNAAGKVLQNSKAGIYTVTVTDSNGCMNAAVFEITEPDTFYVIVDSVKNVTCTGADDGAVYLRASNGHVISAIQANRGKVGSSNVSQLAAGKYSFWVENTNGCGTTVDFEIRNPAPIKVSEYKNVSPRCDEEKDGIVELTASGGNGAPYFFVWDDGVTNANRYDLAAGRHTVMVTDVKGCVTQKDIYVAPKKLAMDFRLDEVGCSEQADARLVVNVDEATLPYALYMNGVRVGQNQKVMAGNYVLTLVDADSCSVSKKMVVEPNRGSNLFFASAFTPNGDGLNDTYELKGSDECLTNARFEIYTRWGGKVFSTDRPFEEYWDGTINGQPAKADIYMYNFISDEKQETGYLNVLK
jgi:gliding motility-associated-like protein